MKKVLFNKDDIRNSLDIEDIFTLLEEWGGDPYYQGKDIIVSKTICHHPLKDDMSHKLYYYNNSKLFQCWTNCGGFDIFDLVIKVMAIQYHKEYNLYNALVWIANRFGFNGEKIKHDDLEDWSIIDRYENIDYKTLEQITLKEFDSSILDKFNYNVKILPWLNEGISQEALNRAKIGFYPGGDQITIPHYDANNRLIGIRGRALCKSDAELYGKYRPLYINNITYAHPLGVNLYNLNNSKDNIKTVGKAIVLEGEKSCLQYATMFGFENDISVATCGSNLSAHQVKLLLDSGAKEIIIGFDKQWKVKNDEEFIRWVNKLKKINEKFKNYAIISFLFDKDDMLNYKSSPTDEGKEKFLSLFKNRIII